MSNNAFVFAMLFSFCLLFPAILSAQEFQMGISAGIAHYQGDLTPTPKNLPVSLGQVGPSTGVFGRWLQGQRLAMRIGLQYGFIHGADARSHNSDRIKRNLSFQTNIFELSIIEEFNLFKLNGRYSKRFTPYFFAGIAGFYFNPKAEYKGQIYALQPLGTEGQGLPGFAPRYSLTQLAIPMGGGLKVFISQNTILSLEIGGRKLFTDYLDDVGGAYVDLDVLAAGNGALAAALSNRSGELNGTEPINHPTGTPRGGKYKDWYYFSTVSLSWYLSQSAKNPRNIGCPTF